MEFQRCHLVNKQMMLINLNTQFAVSVAVVRDGTNIFNITPHRSLEDPPPRNYETIPSSFLVTYY